MIDIQTALYNILHSRYGSDVRQSIHDGIYQINENANEAVQTAKAMGVGTAISSSSSSSAGYVSGNLYLNSSTWDLWQCVGTNSWQNKGNIKGATGATGADGASNYIFIRFSANYDGTDFTVSPTASSQFLGVYYGASSTAPTNKQDYQWTSYVGASGTSAYVHIMYSEDADGSNFVSVPTANTKYVGFYSGTSSTAPANKAYYTWSKYVGSDGTGNGDMTKTEYAGSGVVGTVDKALNLRKTDGSLLSADNVSTKLSKLDSDGKIDYSDVKNKTAIENPATKSNGQVLTYRDGSWVAEDSQGGGGEVVSTSCIFTTDRWLRFNPSNHKGLVIKANTSIRNSQGNYVSFNADTQIDLSSQITSNGTDYFVFMADDGTITCSIDSTVPSGKVKIGRFHTLCADVGSATMIAPPSGIAVGGKYLVKSYRADTDSDFFNLYNMTVSASSTKYETMPHPLSGYVAKDILPESVFCLSWYPNCLVDDGMVYDKDIDKCVDIYLQSGIGLNTMSKYNATHTVSRTAGNHACDFRMVGKKLLTDAEFESASIGSNQGTNISGSSDKTTVGGHVDTSNRRMISAIGCEEMCGYLWQWLDEVSPCGGSSWVTTDGNGSFGQEYGTPYVLFGGGSWLSGSLCGSRCRSSGGARSGVGTDIGGRGLSHLKRGI